MQGQAALPTVNNENLGQQPSSQPSSPTAVTPATGTVVTVTKKKKERRRDPGASTENERAMAKKPYLYGGIALILLIMFLDVLSDLNVFLEIKFVETQNHDINAAIGADIANPAVRVLSNCAPFPDDPTCPEHTDSCQCVNNVQNATGETCCDCTCGMSVYAYKSPESGKLIADYDFIASTYPDGVTPPFCPVKKLIPRLENAKTRDDVEKDLGHTRRASIAIMIICIPFAIYNIYAKIKCVQQYLRWAQLTRFHRWSYVMSTLLVQFFEDIPAVCILCYYVIYRYFTEGAECLNCTARHELCLLSPAATSVAAPTSLPASIRYSSIGTLWDTASVTFSVVMTTISVTISAATLSLYYFRFVLKKGCCAAFTYPLFALLTALTWFCYASAVGFPLFSILYFEMLPNYHLSENSTSAFLVFWITGLISWILGIVGIIWMSTCGMA